MTQTLSKLSQAEESTVIESIPDTSVAGAELQDARTDTTNAEITKYFIFKLEYIIVNIIITI